MKNINEQIDRIKQLFTEERLHGNLVENDNDKLLTEQEKQKRKLNKGLDRARKKLSKKLENAKSKEEINNILDKMGKKVSKLYADYRKNPKAFNTKKVLFKNSKYKLYAHKDKSNPLMMVSLGNGTAEEGSIWAPDLIKSYYKEKKGIDDSDIEIIEMSNGKFKSGKEYIVFSVIDNSDILTSEEEPETTDNSQVDSDDTSTDNDKGATGSKTKAGDGSETDNDKGATGSKTKAGDGSETDNDKESDKAKSKPEKKADDGSKSKPEKKADDGSKSETPKTGDFTKPLQRLGGSQKGYTYHLVGPKKAEKRDATTGKVVATYIKETTFNKKALFESAYTFDINNSLTENWKWVEGNGGKGQTFSDNLSKKFDDAIAQISGETPVDSNTKTDTGDDTPTDKEVEDASNAELNKIIQTPTNRNRDGGLTVVGPKGWDKYPCVTVYPDRKEKKYKDGTKSYIIGNVLFYSKGICQDTNTKEMKKYECKNGKIFIDGKEWTPSSEPVDNNGPKPESGDKSSEGGNIYQQLSNNPTPKFIADTIKGADKLFDDEEIAQAAFAAIKDIDAYFEVSKELAGDVYGFIKDFMDTDENYHEGNKIPTIDKHLLSIFGSNEEHNKFVTSVISKL